MIRNATYKDAPGIRTLMNALGYNTTISLLIGQLERSFGQQDHQVVVYEQEKEVVGFISVHYLPQLGFDGGLVLITYLAVDAALASEGIDKALEEHVSAQAWKRKCDRIQVHCSDWRVPAHQFYQQQGYREYPKYYSKRLIYAE